MNIIESYNFRKEQKIIEFDKCHSWKIYKPFCNLELILER